MASEPPASSSVLAPDVQLSRYPMGVQMKGI